MVNAVHDRTAAVAQPADTHAIHMASAANVTAAETLGEDERRAAQGVRASSPPPIPENRHAWRAVTPAKHVSI